MPLCLGLSPCPNDTYAIYALAQGLVDTGGLEYKLSFLDVEALNQAAGKTSYDITKLSFHSWLLNREIYRLLPVGAALGFGCGPLVVCRQGRRPASLSDCSVILPGKETTAALLFRLWQPEARGFTCTQYDKIFAQVQSGAFDCGIVIHEGRFTYAEYGLECICDLGAWWEETTSLPLPLGCLAARNTLAPALSERFVNSFRLSLTYARTHRQEAVSYAARFAQEMDPHTLEKHIDTFVNAYTFDLGSLGGRAIAKLESMALEAGVIA